MAGPIIRLPAMEILTGLSRSAIYDRMNKNSPRYVEDFPKSFRLDGGAVGWFKLEVEAWLEKCATSGRHGASPKPPRPPRSAVAAPASSSRQLQGQDSASISMRGHAPRATRQGAKPRNLADAIVQGGQVNDRLRHFLELKAWTPAMGAMLISGIDAPQDCTAIPDQGVGVDGKPLHPGDSRLAGAHRILREWHDWQEDTGDQTLEIEPVRFLNWCLRDEISTEWLGLCLDLIGFTDPTKIDLTSSRFALLTSK